MYAPARAISTVSTSQGLSGKIFARNDSKSSSVGAPVGKIEATLMEWIVLRRSFWTGIGGGIGMGNQLLAIPRKTRGGTVWV